MADGRIEWTQKTWNPTTGCDKASQGASIVMRRQCRRRIPTPAKPRSGTGQAWAVLQRIQSLEYRR